MKMRLMTLAGVALAAAVFSGQAAVDPKPLWDKHCASCHGKDGKGDTKMGRKAEVRDYTDAKVQESIKDDAGFKAVKEGLNDKGKERMKPFAEKLSDEEIKALMGYIRTFKK